MEAFDSDFYHTIKAKIRECDNQSKCIILLLNSLPLTKPICIDDRFELKWTNIENAIKHHLYDEIASSLIVLVNSKKDYKNIDEMLKDLANKTHTDIKETNYVKYIMNKVALFYLQRNSM